MALDPLTWAAIIGGVANLGGSLLEYRGASRAGDRYSEALDRSEAEQRRMHAAEMLMQNRRFNQSLGAMISRAGAQYGNFRLPILNRHGSGWPSQQGYMDQLRSGWNPLSDEDIQYLLKHGRMPPGPQPSHVPSQPGVVGANPQPWRA